MNTNDLSLSSTLKDRIYGLIIGGAIADAMGSVVSYAPDLEIDNPFQSTQVNIKPGYWTDPTTLWLHRMTKSESKSESESETETETESESESESKMEFQGQGA